MGLLSTIETSLDFEVAGVRATHALLAALAVVVFVLFFARKKDNRKLPPHVPHLIPFVGSLVTFGIHPVNFLLENKKKYGDVFSFTMFGKKMTYFLGNDACNFAYNAKGHDVSAEDAYAALTVPVFGEGVVYDVPNAVLLEQKRMIKGGLSSENLRAYVPMIEEETRSYFERWGNEGEADLLKAFSEVIIMTASRCLMGKEIRSRLDEKVAALYHDLDNGFVPINFLMPNLPLPMNWKRDRAHKEMADLFRSIMKERRQNNESGNSDILETLMNSEYRDGRKTTDTEVAHLMIALLMAGQHTSSATSTWLGCHLADSKESQNAIFNEYVKVRGSANPTTPLDHPDIDQMEFLDRALMETLRLHPPVAFIMRKVKKDIEYKGYTIPEGHMMCMSPAANHLDPEAFENPTHFDPDRHLPGKQVFGEKEGRFIYLPFGAGRHRCIGETFAYVQLKSLMSTFISMFEIDYPEGRKLPEPDFSNMFVLPKAPVIMRYKRRTPK